MPPAAKRKKSVGKRGKQKHFGGKESSLNGAGKKIRPRNLPVKSSQLDKPGRSMRLFMQNMRVSKAMDKRERNQIKNQAKKRAQEGTPKDEPKITTEQFEDSDIKKPKPKEKAYEFQTKLRPGESFRSYQKRISTEKRLALLETAQKLKQVSKKRKQFLDNRKKDSKQKAREKREKGSLVNRNPEDESDEEDILSYARSAYDPQLGGQEAASLMQDAILESRMRKLSRKGPQEPQSQDFIPKSVKRFQKDKVAYGEVAMRPPIFTKMPKQKRKNELTQEQIMILTRSSLSGTKGEAEAQDEDQDSEDDLLAAELAEQAEQARAIAQAQMRQFEIARTKAQQAYKQMKQAKAAEERQRKALVLQESLLTSVGKKKKGKKRLREKESSFELAPATESIYFNTTKGKNKKKSRSDRKKPRRGTPASKK